MVCRSLLLGWVVWLGSASLPADEKKVTPAERQDEAVPAAVVRTEMRALWQKLGPHAPEGSKLAADNKGAFEAYYLSAARQLAKTNPEDVPRDQELMSLMCLPSAYGWPMYRPFGKGSKYTGLVPIFEGGEYEITMEIWPEGAEASIVIEVDAVKQEQSLVPNKAVRIGLRAGVRALTVRTDDEVNLHFSKLQIRKADGK